MLGRRVAAAAVAAVTLAGCSGGEDGAPATTVPPTSADTTSTTAPSPTESTDSTTSTTPTTAVPTTDTTSTSAPLPTTAEPPTTDSTTPTSTADPNVDAAVQARLDVVDTVRAAYQLSLDVVRDPESDAKRDVLADYFVAPLLEGWINIVQRYRTEGLREIENPEEPDSFDAELASLAVNEALDFATLQGCSVTSGIVLEVGGNADGSDRVIEDRISRSVVEFEVRHDGDSWKVASVRKPEVAETIASCS